MTQRHAIEIRTQRQDEAKFGRVAISPIRKPGQQRIDEVMTEHLVADEREHLFELVSDQQDSLAGARASARSHHISQVHGTALELSRKLLHLLQLFRGAPLAE